MSGVAPLWPCRQDAGAVSVGSFEFIYQSSLKRESPTIAGPPIVDPDHVLGNLLSRASPDMMHNIINGVICAHADQVCGAESGQPSTHRVAQCNGHRHRPVDTRAGTLDVADPKLCSGSYHSSTRRFATAMKVLLLVQTPPPGRTSLRAYGARG